MKLYKFYVIYHTIKTVFDFISKQREKSSNATRCGVLLTNFEVFGVFTSFVGNYWVMSRSLRDFVLSQYCLSKDRVCVKE